MNIYKPTINRYANKVGLFCNARDEKNIKEWAAHHLLIGFDIIIIFDHKSHIPLSHIFSKFDKRVIIIKTNLPDGNIKTKLMNYASEIAKKLNLDWFIYLDADEFLILNNKFKGVKHFLNTYSYADSLGVNWLMFGTNHLINDPSGLIMENYSKSCKNLDQHVKCFVRTNEVIYSNNPHYYKVRNPYKMLDLTFNIMKPPQYFNKLLTRMPYYMSPAYIAHYVYQSEETYIKRKINIIGDNGIKRCNLGKEIHKLYNDIENLQPQKYIKQIKEFLLYYS
jgi:hypothetical protein